MTLFPKDARMNPWPFPYAVFDGLWGEEPLTQVFDEFPTVGWKSYQTPNEYKLESANLGPVTRHIFTYLGSQDVLDELTALTGIEDLSMEIAGGGYHLIPPGGRLAVHTDFNRSPETDLYRRINLLVYLNRDWQDPGGCLELWDGEEHVSITPEWNRTVLFETSDRSWHGHPVPAERWRASIAAYYYSPHPAPDFAGAHSTVWLA